MKVLFDKYNTIKTKASVSAEYILSLMEKLMKSRLISRFIFFGLCMEQSVALQMKERTQQAVDKELGLGRQ